MNDQIALLTCLFLGLVCLSRVSKRGNGRLAGAFGLVARGHMSRYVRNIFQFELVPRAFP